MTVYVQHISKAVQFDVDIFFSFKCYIPCQIHLLTDLLYLGVSLLDKWGEAASWYL